MGASAVIKEWLVVAVLVLLGIIVLLYISRYWGLPGDYPVQYFISNDGRQDSVVSVKLLWKSGLQEFVVLKSGVSVDSVVADVADMNRGLVYNSKYNCLFCHGGHRG